jgi:hypothetical protein
MWTTEVRGLVRRRSLHAMNDGYVDDGGAWVGEEEEPTCDE